MCSRQKRRLTWFPLPHVTASADGQMVEYLTDARSEHSIALQSQAGIPSLQMLAPQPLKAVGSRVWSSSIEWAQAVERFWRAAPAAAGSRGPF